MTDTVWAAIVGGAAGIITGGLSSIVAPWAVWGIEKRKSKRAYRIKLIDNWRKMLQEAASYNIGRENTKLIAILERHEDYLSLSGHIANNYQEYRKRHATVDTPVFLRFLTDEVSRIEKEWDLV